jgi:hypothetical protein
VDATLLRKWHLAYNDHDLNGSWVELNLPSLLIGLHVALRSESGYSLQSRARNCVVLPRRELCRMSVGMDLDRLVVNRTEHRCIPDPQILAGTRLWGARLSNNGRALAGSNLKTATSNFLSDVEIFSSGPIVIRPTKFCR